MSQAGSQRGTFRIVPAHVRPEPDRNELPRVGRTMVVTGPRQVVLNYGTTLLVCSPDGSIAPRSDRLGLYSDDTRFLSEYEARINGRTLRLLGMSRLSYRQARWLYLAEPILSIAGEVRQTTCAVTLDRLLGERQLDEDITVSAYGRDPLSLMLSIELESDFADLFEVRSERWQRRPNVATVWRSPDRLETRYTRKDFVRDCVVRIAAGSRDAEYANGQLQFPIDIEPGQEWRLCLQYEMRTARGTRIPARRCPIQTPVVDQGERMRRRWVETVSRVHASDQRLSGAFEQAVDDFAALRLHDHDFSTNVWIPAAGIPWFAAPFGRDSIIASIQALPVHPLFAIGTLQKLAAWQATEDDPARDAEPGKIPHELRVGEWAHFGTSPHSPYYGTADATPLYLLLLGSAYRWLGDATLLHRFRDTALRCLEWIDHHGDCDGDGFQEYRPRSPHGYRNQCWRDAEDGVLDEDGNYPPHPIGTCEMQAYVYAAKRAMSRLCAAWGDRDLAERLAADAQALQQRFVDTWWLEDEGTLAFALDGRKRLLRTATSNPGHCLWLGIVDAERGRRVAARLMRPDLFSGWGLRTLSDAHPRFDPHSYQRGSVWPHDTMLAAAGMRRYGLVEECWRLIDSLLSATAAFERAQLPELFAGLCRGDADTPMPYEHANVPQAWAAGTAFHAIRILLGFEPDAPTRTVYLDPALPPWCPEVTVENVRVGSSRVRIHAWRTADGSSDVQMETVAGAKLSLIRDRAPWLGVPPA